MKKESKFNEFHKEPFRYDSGTFVVSAELYSRDEATILLVDAYNDYWQNKTRKYESVAISLDRVRWCIHADDYERENEPAWYLGSRGKGSKPVWILT